MQADVQGGKKALGDATLKLLVQRLLSFLPDK